MRSLPKNDGAITGSSARLGRELSTPRFYSSPRRNQKASRNCPRLMRALQIRPTDRPADAPSRVTTKFHPAAPGGGVRLRARLYDSTAQRSAIGPGQPCLPSLDLVRYGLLLPGRRDRRANGARHLRRSQPHQRRLRRSRPEGRDAHVLAYPGVQRPGALAVRPGCPPHVPRRLRALDVGGQRGSPRHGSAECGFVVAIDGP